MFYYKNWDNFCSRINNLKIHSLTADSIIDGKAESQFVLLKHDVETNPSKALELAKIESKYNLSGSYYCQAYLLNDDANVKILNEIRDLGHEVSYHYDVLDANNGDFNKAEKEFDENLLVFRSHGFDIKTVCQHGNPIKNRIGYTSNRDFFRSESLSSKYRNISDIVVNFKNRTDKEYLYISDAGYSWNIISDPENNDRIESTADIPLQGFSEIINILKKNNSIIISTHPHRWKKTSWGIYSQIILFNFVKKIVKFISKIPFVKIFLNKFYYLAKKI